MIDYLTLEQMRDQIGRHIQDRGSVRDTKVDEWINTGYYHYASVYDWPQLKVGFDSNFTTGDKNLYLPKDCWSVYLILNGNFDELLGNASIRSFFSSNASTITTSGVPIDYAMTGERSIKSDFHTAAEILEITATTSTTVDVVVHGILNSDRDEGVETVTYPATAETANSYVDIVSITTNGASDGVITVTGQTSTNEYVTFGPTERAAKYKRLQVHFVPSAAEEITVFYKRRPRRLTQDDMTPEIPISQAVVHYCIAQQYSQQRKWDSGYQAHRAEADAMAQAAIAQEETGDVIHQGKPLARSSTYRRDRIVVSNS